MADTWRKLYGARSGRWLLVEGGEDSIAPTSVTVITDSRGRSETLAYLGNPSDVIAAVHERLATRERYPTVELAKLLHVQEGSVRRYLSAAQSPTLPAAGWANLVRTHIGA